MILAANYERSMFLFNSFLVLDEQRTEEIRIQILNKEVMQSWEETGLNPSQILSKEESKIIEEQSMIELIKERENIKQAREFEEK